MTLFRAYQMQVLFVENSERTPASQFYRRTASHSGRRVRFSRRQINEVLAAEEREREERKS